MRSLSSARISNSFASVPWFSSANVTAPADAVGVATAQVSSVMSTAMACARSALATQPVRASVSAVTAADAARARRNIRTPGFGGEGEAQAASVD
jgi:hypothetical protein